MLARSGKDVIVNVTDATVQSDAYLFVGRDGAVSPELERYLDRSTEARLRAVLTTVAEDPDGLDDDERQALGRFLAFQVARTETFERLGAELNQSLAPTLLASDVAGSHGIDDPAAVRRLVEAAEGALPEELRLPPRPSYLRLMARWADGHVDAFAGLEWAVARADSDVFATSDNPVALFDHDDGARFRGLRVDSSVEVRIALSPTTLLLGTVRRFGAPRVPATDALIASSNEHQARMCSRALYVRPDQPHPDVILQPKPPPLVDPPTIGIARTPGSTRTEPEWPPLNDPAIARIVDETHGPE